MEILKTYIEEQPLIKYCLIKHLILLKSSKYNAYQRGLASIVCKFFDKKELLALILLLRVHGQMPYNQSP